MAQRLIDANALQRLFDAEFKQTMKLIRGGEKHLDNLAEGFTEAIHVAKYIAPTVDAVPVVHGMWVSWEEADNFVPSAHRHECSVCHDAAQVLVNNIELLSDFCPNCGARMDGGVEHGETD